MKLISLWQPWATLVVLGHKKIETRGWTTDYRGPLVIYATLAWNQDCRMMASTEVCWRPLAAAFGIDPHRSSSHTQTERAAALRAVLPFGKIIGVCELSDCLPTESRLGLPGVFDDYPELDTEIETHPGAHQKMERSFGNYSPGRYGFVLRAPRQLHSPIPFKSRQGKLLDIGDPDLPGKIYNSLSS